MDENHLMLELDSSKYHAFLFDFEGTLIDTDELHFKSYTAALKTIDVPYISFEEHIKENVGKTSEEILRLILARNGRGQYAAEELVVVKKFIFAQALMKYGLKKVAGIESLLQRLIDEKKKIALISNGKLESVKKLLELAGFEDVFDLIVTRNDIENPKPDPESYIFAAKTLGFEKENCIGFENDRIGIESLKRSGIRTVGVSSYDFKDRFGKFTEEIEIIKDFEDISIN
jgi:HAD superfamily hydrolase (TIGR01509 family)